MKISTNRLRRPSCRSRSRILTGSSTITTSAVVRPDKGGVLGPGGAEPCHKPWLRVSVIKACFLRSGQERCELQVRKGLICAGHHGDCRTPHSTGAIELNSDVWINSASRA